MRYLPLAFTILSACAAAHLPVAAPPGQPQARLLFEVDGQPLRIGVVHAKVGGVSTLAMIDSGAGRHVMSSTLAKRLGLPIVDSEDTTHDAAGRVLTFGVVPDASIEIDGLGVLPEQPPVVLDLPVQFDEMGVGLILSPQRAVDDGRALSIDYRSGELMVVADEAPQQEGLAARDRWPEPSRCAGSGERSGPLYSVEATIDGERVPLTLDTGADATCVFGGAPIARVLRSRYKTTAESALVAGGPIVTHRTPAIRVHVGRVTALQTLPILPRDASGTCGQQGNLGLDVLRKCVVVISREHADVRCPS
jgi:hypothetical protein